VDVKYILLESMSHHMFPGLVASMDWDNLDNMLQEISKFHGDYQREAADLIILAYRHNTYSKVLEFVAFKGRLERSFQHLVVQIESIMLSLKRKANKLEEFEVWSCSLLLHPLQVTSGEQQFQFVYFCGVTAHMTCQT
jgi:N-terminal acetyltransferase B complex non-catalytic subunit